MRPLAFWTACALAGVLICSRVSATQLYTVTFTNGAEYTRSSSVPFSRDSTLVLPQSNGDGFATVHGFADRGSVGATTRIDANWWNDFSGAFNSNTYFTASTDDFLITGPAGPTTLTGSLRLGLRGANPFVGGADLALYLPRASVVRVTIFDISGRVVRALGNDWQSEGEHDLFWDGRVDDGSEAPTGLYLTRAESDWGSVTLRLVHLR